MKNSKIISTIIELKHSGFDLQEILNEISKEEKISLPTVRKYYKLDTVPEDLHRNLEKPKVFDAEPFRSTILGILDNFKGDVYSSSIYDVLEEMYIESGEYERLPGCERTLRNYIQYLKKKQICDFSLARQPRIYRYVPDMPPGTQMEVDFGQQRLSNGVHLHFIVLLLRYSKYIYVYVQDHKFNSEDACTAIYRCFRHLGGRPKELVIDQDSVFVQSEQYGEVITTQIFDDFLKEQDMQLFTCRKADPESKGGVEQGVKTFKQNYLSARLGVLKDAEEAREGAMRWCRRKNGRINQATFRKPAEVFISIEKPALREGLPSIYDYTPGSYRYTSMIKGLPYISYESSKYSVPARYVGNVLKYKVIKDKLHIYEENGKFVCTHLLSTIKGGKCTLPEHGNQHKEEDYLKAMEALRKEWNVPHFQEFVEGVLKTSLRNAARQLKGIQRFLENNHVSLDMAERIMKECCRIERFGFINFKNTYRMLEAGLDLPSDPENAAALVEGADDLDMAYYQNEFDKRME